MPEKSSYASARKRQWGAERRIQPLPVTHPNPSDRKLVLGRLAIIVTILAWVIYVVSTILRQVLDGGAGGFRFTMDAVSYVVVVTFLTFSALMYLVARQGALQRFRAHARAPRAELDLHFAGEKSAMTVLVPSYAEEPDVVRQTLWSAALQEYPSVRVVLLVDDPPFPTDPAIAARLEATRALTADIDAALREPALRFGDAQVIFDLQLAEHGPLTLDQVRELAGHFSWAGSWLTDMADAEQQNDHVDVFFIEQVLLGLSEELTLTGAALNAAADQNEMPSLERVRQLYRRLVRTFSAELTTFERKRYASLSQEANKAMNLNAYIGLMGHDYVEEHTPQGTILRVTSNRVDADLLVDDSEFLLTLDADSLLLREYCLRLVHLLQQPGNERVAVTQTPYSSFRGAATRIERLAGATTDIQHILHQGMTKANATFWVGANAVIRKSALEDIVETERIGGFDVHRYVQDRTVIEDTESSIDLGTHGWSLVNYPERLSYSATPPDFGSLIVQRRRWANGGLLIMPKLVTQLRERRKRGERVGFTESLLRINYMMSIAWASFGLVFLLVYPYDSRLLSPFVLVAALPYFLAMGSDLRYCGYKFSDIFRIYGFNLILLPVQLAGVLKSLQQAVTGKKIPFARTPKVRNRTASPVLYVVFPVLIIAFSLFTLWRDILAANWGNAAFAGLNAVLATWAFFAYIGVGAFFVDIWVGMTGWLFVENTKAKTAEAGDPQTASLDWRAVLYHGNANHGEHIVHRRTSAVVEAAPVAHGEKSDSVSR
ncbi:glycosyltransferase family 2 protein [Leifsonia sp. Root112D2]|uniref:glycosyltransferase family 2 protein n=1 Tax=Leifsonia sp. Root112D2 TaxID=1736426 RepID=UPI0006F8FDA8|nr:glycosyltransferase family 2 protein [Leifsonia sp. Root112D2]KQV04940.1 glycosyltransferase [Leifsonia sp. Root112D2]